MSVLVWVSTSCFVSPGFRRAESGKHVVSESEATLVTSKTVVVSPRRSSQGFFICCNVSRSYSQFIRYEFERGRRTKPCKSRKVRKEMGRR